MIRWYDYVVAIVMADFILLGLIIGFYGTSVWHGFFGGAIAAFTYRFWADFYCIFRRNKERQ